MEFLYMLEKIRVPGLNEFMLAITTLGEETAFLVVALIVFWCFSKRTGYFMLTVGLSGSVISQWLKIEFREPRPWVKDPDFTILEQAREAAGGYSFPSGHTQSAVGTFGALSVTTGKKWFSYLCLALAALVAFSRMYIGVHTPMDVAVGAGLSIMLIVFLSPVMLTEKDRTMLALAGLALLSTLYMVYVEFTRFPVSVDAENLNSAVKNAYTLLGTSYALLLVYPLEKRWVAFEEKAVWWVQLLKVGIGLLLVLGVKEGLRAPLDAIFAGHMISRAVRYFLIVVVAGLLWPMCFRFFHKLEQKEN